MWMVTRRQSNCLDPVGGLCHHLHSCLLKELTGHLPHECVVLRQQDPDLLTLSNQALAP